MILEHLLEQLMDSLKYLKTSIQTRTRAWIAVFLDWFRQQPDADPGPLQLEATCVANELQRVTLARALIKQPTSGSAFAIGEGILFAGAGTDPEDGTLTDGSLKWLSDHDGLLGTGEAIRVVLSGEPEGQKKHIVTLEVTDTDGNTASDAIEVLVLDLQ